LKAVRVLYPLGGSTTAVSVSIAVELEFILFFSAVQETDSAATLKIPIVFVLVLRWLFLGSSNVRSMFIFRKSQVLAGTREKNELYWDLTKEYKSVLSKIMVVVVVLKVSGTKTFTAIIVAARKYVGIISQAILVLVPTRDLAYDSFVYVLAMKTSFVGVPTK